MAKLSQLITCIGLNILWGLRPRGRRANSGVLEPRREQKLNTSDDGATLRALLQRFPFWINGRALLGEVSLRHNDVATAYAEAQALRILARQGSKHQATALFLLGRCFLQRGEAASAFKLFTEAHVLSPHDYRIQEERSAACTLSPRAFSIMSVSRGADCPPACKAVWIRPEQSSPCHILPPHK